MNLKNLLNRVTPLARKATSNLPLVPWRCAAFHLDPRSVGVKVPPVDIVEIKSEENLKLLRFAGKHEAWFPQATEINRDLWNEYLSVYWEHFQNAHYYLKEETPIREGDVCIDCGGCEGFFVFQALERGAGKVICIEPNPEMAACLRKTFAEEISRDRVILVEAAVGAFCGETSFDSDPSNPAAGKATDSGSIAVKVERIDSLVRELNIEQVDFIKMDIEGAEIQALEGAYGTLVRFKPRLAICTYHKAYDYAAIRAILLGAGYGTIHPKGLTHEYQGPLRPVLVHAK